MFAGVGSERYRSPRKVSVLAVAGRSRRSPSIRCIFLAASADHHDGPVSQVDHFVRGAAEYCPSKVAPAPGAHDDEAGVVFLSIFDDLTRRMPEYGLAYLPMGINSRLGQRIDPSPDRLPCLPSDSIGVSPTRPHS